MPSTKQSGAERRAYSKNPKREPDYRSAATGFGTLTLDVPNRVQADDDLETAVKSGVSKRTQKKLGTVHNETYRPGEDYPKGVYMKKGGKVRGDGCCIKGKTRGRFI